MQDLFGQRLTAREIFQLLVGVGQAVFAHHDLHGFTQDLPDAGQIALCGRRIERQTAEATARGFDRDQQVPDRDANVAQRRGVAEIALQPRDRQFVGKCPSRAIAMPQLASEFSKLIGLTLCGIVDEPTSPFTAACLK